MTVRRLKAGREEAHADREYWASLGPDVRVLETWRLSLELWRAPVADIRVEDLAGPDLVYQVGVPPRRIDVLTTLDGISFERAWSNRVRARLGRIECAFIGREDLITNKRAVGRPRDLADLDDLGA